jgi:endonuclease/exonuclease/phosphatase family metal-dependent hydrolase
MSDYRILTLNIHKGFSMSNRRFTLDKIRHCLRESKANVVFLQEVVGENIKHKKKISEWPDSNQLEFLADSVWQHYAYGKNAIYQHGHHGNAILSEIPFLDWQNINISCLSFSQRGILHGKTSENIHLLCVHMGLFEKERRLQVKQLVEYVEAEIPSHEPMILAGDLNDWRLSCHHYLQGVLKLEEAHLSSQGALAKTYPARFPLLKMDRIYQRGFQVNQSQILDGADWQIMSDHRALLTELKLLS